MRIAIDARPLSSPLTGIGRYTLALVERLIETNHEWFLYSDRPLLGKTPAIKNATVRTGTASGGSPGSLRWAQWEYVKWAKKDAIEIFWSPRHHLPLLLPSKIKTVVTIHDLVWKRYPETMLKKNFLLEKFLMGPSIRKADQVIAVSSFTASEIENFYPSAARKTSVIYEAADFDRNADILPEGMPDKYYLFVGTLEPRKNLELLLTAYAETDRAIPLVIAGGAGWGNVELEEIVKDLSLDDDVFILGYVNDNELKGLYSKAYALLMPSHYEGFGLPVVEAMNYGVPCIVSRGTALEEICDDAALLVNPSSKQELVDALSKICSSIIHNKLSENAATRSQQFNWDTAMSETLTVLTSQ